MADIINFRPKDKSDAQTCARIYERLNFETSNVVFAPTFCVRAQEVYNMRDGDRRSVEDVA